MQGLRTHTLFVNLKKEKYTFQVMEEQLVGLVHQFPFLNLEEIGKSFENRPLYCLSLGHGPRRIHVNGAHHANEWITTVVLMKSIAILCEMIKEQAVYEDIHVGNWLEEVTYDFVPMVNPDGVELCIEGLNGRKDGQSLRALNEGELNFSRWKANIRGVDLNRNYNAGFETYSLISEKKSPSYAYYSGQKPESEPETKALADLTRRRDYDMVLAYHTQGEVIYWTYGNLEIAGARAYADMFSQASGYALDQPESIAASGGYKDWFIDHFKKPGFTIECGYGENPLSIIQVEPILTHTLPILLLAAKDLRKGEKEFGNLS